ncbi:hypothetical protein Pyn_21389 [Prunus yedoensis var. nudiflora]|uniref:Uncharacterized protein n=1 Tax=Prunus yedoensis var. nudiflora TaxID=2094558 RepID=A0A314XU38_PRUYE|nr:hypothetical protein Pyn_21389 [Prunus yedoensis var. nudiflora]
MRQALTCSFTFHQDLGRCVLDQKTKTTKHLTDLTCEGFKLSAALKSIADSTSHQVSSTTSPTEISLLIGHIAKPIAWCHVVSEVDTLVCRPDPIHHDRSLPQKKIYRPDHIASPARPRSARWCMLMVRTTRAVYLGGISQDPP